MNDAYNHARFRAELPDSGLPESFAIITACNPNGKTISDEENLVKTEGLRQQLVKLGYLHFPVTGYDAQSPHEEAGFGVLCDFKTASSIGHALLQEAIFIVERGIVSLIELDSAIIQKREILRPWAEMADQL